MKTTFKVLALASALGLSISGPAMAKETITLGEQSWDGARAVMSLLKVVLEDRLDVDVNVVSVDQSVMWVEMDKGKGAIDVVPDAWFPANNDKFAKYVQSGSKESVKLNDKPYKGAEGFYIPGYIQDEHGVKSVHDLAKPEVAKLFDMDGDGSSEFWPGGPGWDVTNTYLVKAKSYGFAEQFKPMEVSDAAFKGQLKNAFRKKKGILFYYWSPEWIHAEYDLRLLEEPPFDGFAMDNKKDDPQYNAQGCWNMLQPEASDDWYELSEVKCASVEPTVHVAYAKSLEERAPKVAKFLQQVNFDASAINQWILKVGRDKEDPEAVVKSWIEAHPDTVNAWLEGI